MITRVLFVDSDAEALARIKQALERAGDYEAKVFVTGQAALEYAAHNPPAVAVISLNVQDLAPDDLAARLRRIQPGLPIVLRTPASATSARGKAAPTPNLLAAIAPQGVLEGGYTTRMLVPLVEAALHPPPASSPDAEASDDNDTDTKDVPTVDSDAVRQYLATAQPDDDVAAFGEVLEAIEPGTKPQTEDPFKALVDSLRAPPEDVPLHQRRSRLVGWVDRSQDDLVTEPPKPEAPPAAEQPEDPLFDRLAAEEPPMPAEDEGGTISDLIAITDPDFHETPTPEGVDVPDDLIEDEDRLLLNEDERHLLDALTAFADSMAEEERNALEAAARTLGDTTGTSEAVPATDDSARVALELTQRTLESSAQATFLLHSGEVLALAGALPESDITALAALIDTDAVILAGGIKMRFVTLPQTSMHYMLVAAPTVDDMVLAMVFAEDVHLSAIRQQFRVLAEALTPFLEPSTTPAPPEPEPPDPGLYETPAPDPSQPLLQVAAEPDDDEHGLTGVLDSEGEDAHALPHEAGEGGQATEAREATESAPAIEPAALVKYACTWLLRDPDATLDAELMTALPGWLETLVTGRHWLADSITVEPDYVSLVISLAPGDAPAEVVETLMAESEAHILAERPDLNHSGSGLWADAYYIVAPGRPLTGEEISRFISYQRAN
ncbi:MAG: transposase [Anaerolineae bacterium]|nr:transposase [Anaerolineae bacterium]